MAADLLSPFLTQKKNVTRTSKKPKMSRDDSLYLYHDVYSTHMVATTFSGLYRIHTERRQPFLRIGVIRAPMRPNPGGEQPLFVDCLRTLVLRPQVLL